MDSLINTIFKGFEVTYAEQGCICFSKNTVKQ